MVRLQERVDVGGNGGGGQGHCDLKLKVDAIEQVHVVVQLGLFVVVESRLVAEVHLVEARVMRVSKRWRCAVALLGGGVGRWNERELNTHNTHALGM
jgi:hypothetical protein